MSWFMKFMSPDYKFHIFKDAPDFNSNNNLIKVFKKIFCIQIMESLSNVSEQYPKYLSESLQNQTIP